MLLFSTLDTYLFFYASFTIFAPTHSIRMVQFQWQHFFFDGSDGSDIFMSCLAQTSSCLHLKMDGWKSLTSHFTQQFSFGLLWMTCMFSAFGISAREWLGLSAGFILIFQLFKQIKCLQILVSFTLQPVCVCVHSYLYMWAAMVVGISKESLGRGCLEVTLRGAQYKSIIIICYLGENRQLKIN